MDGTWIQTDDRMCVTVLSRTEQQGWHWVRQTLSDDILTYDGIPLYAWDGVDNVVKRSDQDIAKDRREKKKGR